MGGGISRIRESLAIISREYKNIIKTTLVYKIRSQRVISTSHVLEYIC